MGNHLSCVSPAALKRLQAPSDSTQTLIRFLHLETGTVSELEGPLTAAEVMMEFPAQFLSRFPNASSSGRRISALPADEALQAAERYLLLPMHRLNARFSSEERAFFASLEVGGDSGKKPRRGAAAISQSKVAPFPESTSSPQTAYGEGLGVQSMRSLSFKPVDAAGSRDLQGPAASLYMACRSKSWIPKLETIAEFGVAA